MAHLFHFPPRILVLHFNHFIDFQQFYTSTAIPPRMSIPYWRLYWFGHRYDIFRIPVNTGVPFRVYRYFIYIYIYMYVCVCVYIIINIKVYHKTFPQFRTNYSWFYTLVSIKREKKNRKLKSYHCILSKKIILIS